MTLYMVGSSQNYLSTIDVGNAVATRIGTATTYGISSFFTSATIAYDGTSMYHGCTVEEKDANGFDRQLAILSTLDTTTGIASRITKLASQLESSQRVSIHATGMAFHNGTLYVIGGNSMYSVDTTTGLYTYLSWLGGSVNCSGLLSRGDNLYTWDTRGRQLLIVNPTTGVTTGVGIRFASRHSISCIGEDSGVVYGAGFGKLYTINITTSVTTEVVGTSGFGILENHPSDLANIPAVTLTSSPWSKVCKDQDFTSDWSSVCRAEDITSTIVDIFGTVKYTRVGSDIRREATVSISGAFSDTTPINHLVISATVPSIFVYPTTDLPVTHTLTFTHAQGPDGRIHITTYREASQSIANQLDTKTIQIPVTGIPETGFFAAQIQTTTGKIILAEEVESGTTSGWSTVCKVDDVALTSNWSTVCKVDDPAPSGWSHICKAEEVPLTSKWSVVCKTHDPVHSDWSKVCKSSDLPSSSAWSSICRAVVIESSDWSTVCNTDDVAQNSGWSALCKADDSVQSSSWTVSIKCFDAPPPDYLTDPQYDNILTEIDVSRAGVYGTWTPQRAGLTLRFNDHTLTVPTGEVWMLKSWPQSGQLVTEREIRYSTVTYDANGEETKRTPATGTYWITCTILGRSAGSFGRMGSITLNAGDKISARVFTSNVPNIDINAVTHADERVKINGSFVEYDDPEEFSRLLRLVPLASITGYKFRAA